MEHMLINCMDAVLPLLSNAPQFFVARCCMLRGDTYHPGIMDNPSRLVFFTSRGYFFRLGPRPGQVRRLALHEHLVRGVCLYQHIQHSEARYG